MVEEEAISKFCCEYYVEIILLSLSLSLSTFFHLRDDFIHFHEEKSHNLLHIQLFWDFLNGCIYLPGGREVLFISFLGSPEFCNDYIELSSLCDSSIFATHVSTCTKTRLNS